MTRSSTLETKVTGLIFLLPYCWLKQSRRFLECTDGNFPLQATEKPTMRDVTLDLVLTDKERLVGNVKPKGSLGRSNHEIVEFDTLRGVKRVHSKLTTLGFTRANFGLLRDLLGRAPEKKTWKEEWPKNTG
ncbi:dtw domain-containing protein 2 [Pitangus sulphuratus]|nr:dtw domain-containing protein 2 [Pitangus sulphuratus]